MRIQKSNPNYVFDGFDNVFVPGLPKPEPEIVGDSSRSEKSDSNGE